MLWRERRRRLASARANLAFSKEERDFAGSGFYRVGTVGAVLGEAVSVVSAQGDALFAMLFLICLLYTSPSPRD